MGVDSHGCLCYGLGMAKKDDEAYRMLEDSVVKQNRHTRNRTDIDEETKNRIILNNAKALDEVRKNRGIKE